MSKITQLLSAAKSGRKPQYEIETWNISVAVAALMAIAPESNSSAWLLNARHCLSFLKSGCKDFSVASMEAEDGWLVVLGEKINSFVTYNDRTFTVSVYGTEIGMKATCFAALMELHADLGRYENEKMNDDDFLTFMYRIQRAGSLLVKALPKTDNS
jgi:hypothetical protein